MLVTLAALGMALGIVAATNAPRYPVHKVRLERLGGGLLICGLALLAFAFPMV